MININKIKKNKTLKELLEFSIINIDKSSGPTSFNISDFVRKKLGLRKTSHFGTLDPKVTGVLPIALNRACKLTGFFLRKDKEYVGIMRVHDEKIKIKEIQKIIDKNFLGRIIQSPPVKSRVKRQKRPREVYEFKLLEQDGKDILFRAKVEAGTYIRKLISDLGDKKEIGGAHMLELRRTQAGIFKEDDKEYPSINLYDFSRYAEAHLDPSTSKHAYAGKNIKEVEGEKAVDNKDEKLLREILIPGEIISEIHPVYQIKSKFTDKVLHGSPIFDNFLKDKLDKLKQDEIFCIFQDDKFIGMFKKVDEDKVIARGEFVMQEIK